MFNLGRALGFMVSKVDPYAKLLFLDGVFLLAFLVSELNQEEDFVMRRVWSGESSFWFWKMEMFIHLQSTNLLWNMQAGKICIYISTNEKRWFHSCQLEEKSILLSVDWLVREGIELRGQIEITILMKNCKVMKVTTWQLTLLSGPGGNWP